MNHLVIFAMSTLGTHHWSVTNLFDSLQGKTNRGETTNPYAEHAEVFFMWKDVYKISDHTFIETETAIDFYELFFWEKYFFHIEQHIWNQLPLNVTCLQLLQ